MKFRLSFVLIFSLLLYICGILGITNEMILDDTFINDIQWANDYSFIAVEAGCNEEPYFFEYKNGKWKHRLLALKGTPKFYRWNKNGTHFLFWNNGALYLSSLTTKPVFIDKADETPACWSNNNQWICYIKDNHVWIISKDLKTKNKLTKQPILSALEPKWLQNDDYIIVYGNDGKSQFSTLWKVNLSDGRASVINDSIRPNNWIIWRNEIILNDLITHNTKVLTIDGNVSDITSDCSPGKIIVYRDDESLYFMGSSHTLYYYNNGLINTISKHVYYISFSPRKKHIAYVWNCKLYITTNIDNIPF